MDGKSLGLKEVCRRKAPKDPWFRSPKRSEALRMNASESVPFGRGRSMCMVVFDVDAFDALVDWYGIGSIDEYRLDQSSSKATDTDQQR